MSIAKAGALFAALSVLAYHEAEMETGDLMRNAVSIQVFAP